jgi:hypothetical protein
MKACHHHKETIMLDIYGELGTEARRRLENHLATCEACRREYRHLENMIANLKTTMDPARLSSDEVARLTATVNSRLQKERNKKWWRPNMAAYRPARLIPALATACIIIVVSAIWIYSSFFNTNEFQPTASIREEQLMVNDLEIIENLDLLKEMEAIQKLVKAVDKQPNGLPSGTINRDTQGMRHHVYGKQIA